MAVLTWAARNTHTPLAIPITDASGNALDLTGVLASAITLRVRPDFINSYYTTLAGTVTINSPANAGIITFTFVTADVATVGQYRLNVEIDFGVGNVATAYETIFVITPA